jgi:raffinose/stachyose/melibiose transport system permease protein
MKRAKRSWKSYIGEALMLCLCAVYFIPFYYLIVNTFKPSREATFSPLSLPGASFTLDNYRKAFDTINFLSSLRNSVVITVISVAIIILFGSMAAYTITRRKNKVTKVLFIYFLVGFMVPVQTTMIPLFKLMSSLNLTNSVGGMIVLYSSWCNFAMFMYQGFLGTVPRDLEDAAFIDGCGPFRVFWRIVFPLIKPVTITIMIFDVMWIWNDFMLPYLFVGSSENFTLIMEVYKGVGEFSNNWTTMLCTMVIVLVPITIFYIIMQKHIIAGITSGAVKG